MSKLKQTLAIDFDGVIHTYQTGDWKGIVVIEGLPMKGVRHSLGILSLKYKIIVHTCRAVHPDGTRAVRRYMHKHVLPFDDIVLEKPAAVAYIDDRGYHFTNWKNVLTDFA